MSQVGAKRKAIKYERECHNVGKIHCYITLMHNHGVELLEIMLFHKPFVFKTLI
jgi:hypothetical protein